LRNIYEASREGIAITLEMLLNQVPQEKLQNLLDTPVEDGPLKCTSLAIAALNGHETVVNLLLTTFSCNIESEGEVQFDGNIISG